MISKVITSEEQYKEALVESARLITLDPEPDSPDGDRLNLLAVLIQNYEKDRFKFNLPDPIDAILHRMEEQGLRQRDLVPYIGSKSKVSELLSRKRPLTIQMIRALHNALGIPAEVLLQEPKKENWIRLESGMLDFSKFPIKDMLQRGWIGCKEKISRTNSEQILKGFLTSINQDIPSFAMCRCNRGNTDLYALLAWTTRILTRAKEGSCTEVFKKGSVTKEFMREVVRLSWSSRGPLLSQEFLEKHGISLIIEPSLPKMPIDGGAMMLDERPVIGLTLRHDRIDSFWFTLVHELVHIALHLKTTEELFIDDLDSKGDDPREKETDSLSSDILIPSRLWKTSRANVQKTPNAIMDLAKQLNIHPAVIAGKIRFETNNYKIFSDLVGWGQVRKLFPNISWN